MSQTITIYSKTDIDKIVHDKMDKIFQDIYLRLDEMQLKIIDLERMLK